MSPYQREPDGSLVLAVRVQPGASRSAIVGRHGDALKVRVAAPADKGRANDAVLDLLAGALGVRRSDLAVVAGRTSRAKRVRIAGIPDDDLVGVLALLTDLLGD